MQKIYKVLIEEKDPLVIGTLVTAFGMFITMGILYYLHNHNKQKILSNLRAKIEELLNDIKNLQSHTHDYRNHLEHVHIDLANYATLSDAEKTRTLEALQETYGAFFPVLVS